MENIKNGVRIILTKDLDYRTLTNQVNLLIWNLTMFVNIPNSVGIFPVRLFIPVACYIRSIKNWESASSRVLPWNKESKWIRYTHKKWDKSSLTRFQTLLEWIQWTGFYLLFLLLFEEHHIVSWYTILNSVAEQSQWCMNLTYSPKYRYSKLSNAPSSVGMVPVSSFASVFGIIGWKTISERV